MIYLAAAFIVLWLSVGLYVAFLVTRQRALERELSILEEEIAEERTRANQ